MKKTLLSMLSAVCLLLSLLTVSGVASMAAEEETTAAAQVGETTYDTLSEAFAVASAAAENKTVVLLRDVTDLTSGVKLTKGEVTLDLNGKQLIRAAGGSAPVYTIEVGGTGENRPVLTIIDKTGGGLIDNMHATASTLRANSYGKVIIGLSDTANAFTVQNTGIKEIDRNSTLKVDEYGELVINGGSVKAPTMPNARKTQRAVQRFGTTTVNAGEITGTIEAWNWIEGTTVCPSALTVNNGQISGDVLAVGKFDTADNNREFPAQAQIEIKGGKIGGQVKITDTRTGEDIKPGTAKITVSGGAFLQPVDSQYLDATLLFAAQTSEQDGGYYSYHQTAKAAFESENAAVVTDRNGKKQFYVSFAVVTEASGTEWASLIVAEGDAIQAADMPEAPTREGYTFDGWFAGETKVEAGFAVTANVAAVAKFTEKTEASAPTSATVDNTTAGELTLDLSAGQFDADTKVEIKAITEEKALAAVQTALQKVTTKFKAFSLVALKNNAQVQPNGSIRATFQLPADFSTHAAVYYVAADGSLEKLATTVNAAARTATAELRHFSTYALVDEAAVPTAAAAGAGTTAPAKDVPPTGGDSRPYAAAAVVAVLALTGCVGTLLLKKRCKAGNRS